MMPRKSTFSWLTVFCLLAAGVPSVKGQFVTLVTDFEDPAWTIFVTEVLFQQPSFSGTTIGLDAVLGDSTYLTDVNVDTFSEANSPLRSSASFWGWTDPSQHTAWVRLVTTNSDEIPNPAVHLGGTVRFWASAGAWTDGTFSTPVSTGNVFVGLGVRETGQGVHLGGNGGTSGPIEWVGLDAKLIEILGGTNGTCDTTADPMSDDVQVIPFGNAAGPDDVCVDAGVDGFMQTARGGDDTLSTTPQGLFSIPTDRVMRQYVFDFAALELSGNVFPFTGDAMLGASPNNRGTLDHLVLTNDPINGAVGAAVILVNIDDLEFEAPVLDPPSIVTLPNPPRPLDEQVSVDFVKSTASLVEIVRVEGGVPTTVLGSIAPGGALSIDVPTSPLASGVQIAARQTVGLDTSDLSTPAAVNPAGNGPLRIAMAVRETDAIDHALSCGDDGTGFDPDAPATLEFIGASGTAGFGIPDGRRFLPQNEWFEVVFDPCDPDFGVVVFSGNGALNLNTAPNFTNGVWEGLYFRIDEFSPTTGPYTVFIDDMVIINGGGSGIDCVMDDFESYIPGRFIVGDFGGNGTADTIAEATDIQVVAAGSPVFPGEIIVAPGGDGTLETVPGGDDAISLLHARFNNPGVAGTSVGLAAFPDLAEVTADDSFSGSQSLRIRWAFSDATNNLSVVRLTSNGSLATSPPETFLNPDSVVSLSNDGTLCDGVDDISYSVMLKLAPAEIPADCDLDADVDLFDYGCYQRCHLESPVSAECEPFDVAPNGAPDGQINLNDYDLMTFLLVGPQA